MSERLSAESSSHVPEKFWELIRNHFRVSRDQVEAMVCAFKVHRWNWGCRVYGRIAKPPLSKDTALKILKLYEDFELHEYSSAKVVTPLSEVERFRKEVDELQKRREEKAEMARLKDQEVRSRLEVEGDEYVMHIIEKKLRISFSSLDDESWEYDPDPLPKGNRAALLHNVLGKYGVTANILSEHYDHFVKAVLERGYASRYDPEGCLARVIEWRMKVVPSSLDRAVGNPIFYKGEFEECRSKKIQALFRE
jgi:hypothetical protein